MARDLDYIDRDNFPKNPGDRGYGHGDNVTLDLVKGDKSSVSYETSLSAGQFVNLDGEGGVYRPSVPDNSDDPLTYDAILAHDAENVGDDAGVHLRGDIRAVEEPVNGTNGPTDVRWDVIDAVDGDFIVALR